MSRHFGYKKKKFKINKKLLAVLLSFLLCVVLTILYGHHLKKKAEESKLLFPDTTTDSNTTETAKPSSSREKAPPVAALSLTLSRPFDSTLFNAEITRIKAEGYSAVALSLLDNEGQPLYASKIAAYPQSPDILTDPPAATDTEQQIDPETLISILHGERLYICGCFESRITNTQGYKADFIRNYELALLGELHAAGVDEILLTGLYPTASTIDWIANLYAEIHQKYPELLVGVAVLPDTVFASNSSIFYHTLSEFADFIVLDMTGIETADYKTLLDNASLFFSKYNMRAMISASDSATLDERLSLLHDGAVHNYQILFTENP
ncbi:MAG: hypothetical protein GX303_08920 [Clostridiales bacterium]|nr:hypothetical protein [Clostridiales bacterium]